MKTETKGQPEPVAWAYLPAPNSDAPTTIILERDALAYDREHARPLYDYDVPALLEHNRELRQLIRRAISMNDGSVASTPDEIAQVTREADQWYEDAEEALAAAREES